MRRRLPWVRARPWASRRRDRSMTRAKPRPRARGPVPAGGRRLPFDIAPAASLVGLLVIGVVSFGLLGGSLPSLPGSDGHGGPGGPVRTPTPSSVVVVPDDPRAKSPGSLVYVKDGNLWVQSGSNATQITNGGRMSMPTWSPDGQSIYAISTVAKSGRWPSGGEIHTYNLTVPSLVRL